MNKKVLPFQLVTELRSISDLQIFEAISDREHFSSDFFDYSPVLSEKLADCCADLVVRPKSVKAVVSV